MMRENAQNRYRDGGPEETRPLAALRNDDRHSPLASDTPRSRLKKPSTGLSLPPRPPQSTGATTAKEITNEDIFETQTLRRRNE